MNLLYKSLSDGICKVTLSKELYEREAVFATAYKFENRFDIKIEPEEPAHVALYIKAKTDESISNEEEVIHDLLAELIDQQLRLDIAKRTDSIRQRIYDEAFRPIAGRTKT